MSECLIQELRESRSAAAGSPGSMMKLMEDYKATEFISIFQKFKLAFNLLVSITRHYQRLTPLSRAVCTLRCVTPRPQS